MNTVITCARCFFAFRDNLLAQKHVCPACGTVMILKDDVEAFEHKYAFEVKETNQEGQ